MPKLARTVLAFAVAFAIVAAMGVGIDAAGVLSTVTFAAWRAFALLTCLLRELARWAGEEPATRRTLQRPADIEMALFMRGGA